jgi:hypothetical protein
MGWSSGGEIFDDVARALVDAQVGDELLDRVLYLLAVRLTDQDWDTVDESIDEFAGQPVAQHALRKANGRVWLNGPDGRVDGEIDFIGNADGGSWELDLHDETVTAPGTVDGFNQLIDLWAVAGGTPDYAEAAQQYRLA